MPNFRMIKNLNSAAEILLSGNILIYPTESVFGIGCIPDFLDTVAGIRELKKRDINSGFILVCSSIEQVKKYLNDDVDINKVSKLLKLSSNENPLTIILRSNPCISNIINGLGNTIAIRLTAFKPLIDLCNYIKSPIISTSANLKGGIPATKVEECLHLLDINNKLYIWDNELGKARTTSTIYNFITNTNIRGKHHLLEKICIESN